MVSHAVVIDTGESSVKIGTAGSEEMPVVTPSVYARGKAGLKAELIFGRAAAVADRARFEVSSPIVRGRVENWDELERLWSCACYESRLQIEGSAVLLVDMAHASKQTRQQMAEVFFEKFRCAALYFARAPVLALFSAGQTDGAVLDCGEGLTKAASVSQGFVIRESIVCSALGGRDVDAHLWRRLSCSGYDLSVTSRWQTLRTLKEEHCYVSTVDEEQPMDNQSRSFRLPDGGIISMGAERQLANEILFAPGSVGYEGDAVHELLLRSINACDMNERAQMFSRLVLVGGTTLSKGFCDRLLSELRKEVPRDVKIRCCAPSSRQFSVWTGGSVFASLDSFGVVATSARSYKEHGPEVCAMRCAKCGGLEGGE